MKKLNLLLGLSAGGLLLAGCNGGSSSGSTPNVALAAGVYNVTFANQVPTGCATLNFESIAYSNGTGQVCDDANYSVSCRNVNLAANPCYLVNQTDSGGTSSVTTSWNSCALSQDQTSMTANLNFAMVTPLFNASCTANMTLTQQ